MGDKDELMKVQVYNECITLLWDFANGGGCTYRKEGICDLSSLLAQFYCGHKTTQKITCVNNKTNLFWFIVNAFC